MGRWLSVVAVGTLQFAPPDVECSALCSCRWGPFLPHVEYITSGCVFTCPFAPFAFHILNASCGNSAEFPDSCCRSVCKEVLSLRTLRPETEGILFPFVNYCTYGLVC